jgi:hypothetical protein
VKLRFIEALSSKTSHSGDPVTLVLAEDLRVNGFTVVREGAKAMGQITVAQKSGMLGKGGDLALQLFYLNAGDDRIKLRGSKGQQGDSKIGATIALTVLFGIFGLLKHGKNAEIPAGTILTVYVMDDIAVLPVSGPLLSQPPPSPSPVSAPISIVAESPTPPASAQPAVKAMTDWDVIALKSAGLSDELVIAKIQRTPAGFQLDTNDIIALKKSNVSEAVIEAMMAATAPARERASVAPTAAIAAPQAQPIPESPHIAAPLTPPAGSSQQTSPPTASAPAPPKEGLLAKLKRASADDIDGRKPSTSQAPPAEPPASPQFALTSVTVLSKPAGARILVDGYSAGYTPAVVKLVPGTYKLTLQADGFPAYSQQITVVAGQVNSFGVALDTSK